MWQGRNKGDVMLPSQNGGNGRGSHGRFLAGNAGGPGNPYARRVARLRSALLDAVTDDDLRAIVKVLVDRAKGGDLAAIREVLDRMVGRPLAALALAVEVDMAIDGSDMKPVEPGAVVGELLHEPAYLEWLHAKAMAEDAAKLHAGTIGGRRVD